ncbi:hypothetical protein FACUT_13594 [Fusarium acutatum]|uniref:Uncharacterized protein n=1 Tax=Fusarium acutatum TaxID=78861 RepID=A0A8H4N8I1_9HYPO|nr:hypothetical protein FACUT_13594 [Fusarium acutatum]
MPDNEYFDYKRLYSQLSLEKLAELDCIGLHLNSPEPAIICAQTSKRQANANILLQETPDAIRDFAQQLFAEEQQRLDLRPRGQDPLHDATQANLMANWVRRTGWENLLQDARRDILIAITSLLSDICGSDDRSDLGQDEDVDDDADEDEDEGQESGNGSDNDYVEWPGEDIHDGSDGYSSTMDSPGRGTIAPVDPAADLVLRLAYYMVTEDFEDGRSSSTMLVFFSAVRGLSGTGGEGYLRSHRFTSILSK